MKADTQRLWSRQSSYSDSWGERERESSRGQGPKLQELEGLRNTVARVPGWHLEGT